MPKKILFESAVHQFLSAARDLAEVERSTSPDRYRRWSEFVNSMTFDYPRPNVVQVRWTFPASGSAAFSIEDADFYMRGDNEEAVRHQQANGYLFAEDMVQRNNLSFFRKAAATVAQQAGIESSAVVPDSTRRRLHDEEHFHDDWASSEDFLKIDVRRMNEACTAPEMRYIRRILGDLKGKTLLDVGCGLGEASVYFALEGAIVTATDLSQKMLDVAGQLAKANGTTISVHKSAAEDLALPPDQQFDIIYAGNVLHHISIEPTVRRLVRHLKPGGVFVSWDPVAYNPVINVYRKRAQQVRTVDEHPLRLRDLRTVRAFFGDVQTRWFWLSTLVIFVIMALVQRRDPNKERYWKKVVEESDRWAWLYKPLEAFDTALLALVPFLRPLCWNVVIVARHPLQSPDP